MRDCAEIQGEVRKVRGVSITFDCTPVAVNGIAAGVVISFQNVDKVQQLEGHIRKKLSNKGLTAKHHLSDIVHCSRLIDETIEDACRYAAASSNILIVGETGTGKELFAQGIHNASQRRNGPFVAINCAALPENLLESELFGYVEGAFTGTTRGGKMGLFELAHNGTLFLDEISEIPLNMQSKLLRVLQEHEVRRIGDDRVTAVDVRIISATNVNLHKLVAAKRFRQDLLYRLDVLKITIPPLRRRGEDVIELFHFFLKKFCWKNREALPEVAPDSLHLLREYPFAGNARELRNVVERAAVLRRNRDVLTSADLNRALHPEDIEEVPPLLAATPAPFPPEAPQASGPDNERTGCSRPCAPAAATGPVPPANWAWTEPHYGANSRNIYRNNQYIQQVALLGARPPPQRIVAYMLQRSVASVFRCNSPPPSSPPFRGCAAFPSPRSV